MIDIGALKLLSSSPENALDIGKAAEHLVCANITLRGVKCYLSDQGLPYDVVADVGGKLIKIQVRSSCFPKNINLRGKCERIAYTFNVRRRGKDGKGERLNNTHCDIVALAAIDITKIAYLPVFEVGQTFQVDSPEFPFKGMRRGRAPLSIDEYTFIRSIRRLNIGENGLKRGGDILAKDVRKLSIGEESKTLEEWSVASNTKSKAISKRIIRGWSNEDAVYKPLMKHRGPARKANNNG